MTLALMGLACPVVLRELERCCCGGGLVMVGSRGPDKGQLDSVAFQVPKCEAPGKPIFRL